MAAAAAFLALSTGVAAAASGITEADLNMRRGPGTNYGVITSIPAGAPIEVVDCGGGWCQVAWNGYQGFSSRAYIDIGAQAYGAAPPVVVAPAPYYGQYYHGPRYRNPARRIIRRGTRALRQELRQERREDRREFRQERRQERKAERREFRQERRAGPRQQRRENRREARQERRERRNNR